MASVIVLGGGPAGSSCATLLARAGVPVMIVEKAKFPRFRLGESFLPRSLTVLEETGVLDDVRARFMEKHGARFHDDTRDEHVRFSFTTAWDAHWTYAFHAPRDEFDALLLAHAKKCGAEVREETEALRVGFDGDRASFVELRGAHGNVTREDARFIVDATGRDALVAHADRTTEKIAGLDRTAFYAHAVGVPRAEGIGAGDIDLVVTDDGWLWFIPFNDGRTSVGAVMSNAWVLANKGDANALFSRAIEHSKTARELMASATIVLPPASAADFSYRVRAMHGPGWVAIGDAGGFIDPLFSSGVHIALESARGAAHAIIRALASDADGVTAFDEWDQTVRGGTEVFVLAVRAFYNQSLMRYLFAEKQHTALRRSITSLLSGDVFDADARWLKDTRTRLAAMANAEGS